MSSGRSAEVVFECGDFFLLCGHELFEIVDIVLLLVLVGFEFLHGFDEWGQEFAVAHIVGARFVVIADDQGEAVGRLWVLHQILKVLGQSLLDILRYEA
jgi:hypothetical protein